MGSVDLVLTMEPSLKAWRITFGNSR